MFVIFQGGGVGPDPISPLWIRPCRSVPKERNHPRFKVCSCRKLVRQLLDDLKMLFMIIRWIISDSEHTRMHACMHARTRARKVVYSKHALKLQKQIIHVYPLRLSHQSESSHGNADIWKIFIFHPLRPCFDLDIFYAYINHCLFWKHGILCTPPLLFNFHLYFDTLRPGCGRSLFLSCPEFWPQPDTKWPLVRSNYNTDSYKYKLTPAHLK